MCPFCVPIHKKKKITTETNCETNNETRNRSIRNDQRKCSGESRGRSRRGTRTEKSKNSAEIKNIIDFIPAASTGCDRDEASGDYSVCEEKLKMIHNK